MKIVQNDSVLSVVITLDEFEAGYLRSLMGQLSPKNTGFALKLFNELGRLKLPKYDKQYKNWRTRSKNGNSDSQ